MIKPFEIMSIVEEPDGGQGVTYKASKVVTDVGETQDSSGALGYWESPNAVTKQIVAYYSVPAGEDVDATILQVLRDGGWIQ